MRCHYSRGGGSAPKRRNEGALQWRDQPTGDGWAALMGSQEDRQFAAELPDVLKSSEVMQLLRISRPTLDKLIANRELPGVRRIGKDYRFSKAAILEWMTGDPLPPAER